MTDPKPSGLSVAIRIRPFNEREKRSGDPKVAVSYDHNTVQVNSVPNNVLGFDSTNTDIYDAVAQEVVKSAIGGINGTVFAYGQTSTGKTHTMFGNNLEPGVLPLAIKDIFTKIQENQDREYLLRVSFIEIYNEIIKDLLKPGNDNLKIHQNPLGEIFVGDLTEKLVSSIKEVHELLAVGDDLAGSERVGHTGAEGQRLIEGGHINKSLLSLGTVISKLSDGESHIPYRDSKLTRILQSSLGGNTTTSIICTITPAIMHIDETLSTLRFANRAKKITNKPEVNEIISDGNLIKLYRKEISDLKRKLQELTSNSANSSPKIESKTDNSLRSSSPLPTNSPKRRRTWYSGQSDEPNIAAYGNSLDPSKTLKVTDEIVDEKDLVIRENSKSIQYYQGAIEHLNLEVASLKDNVTTGTTADTKFSDLMLEVMATESANAAIYSALYDLQFDRERWIHEQSRVEKALMTKSMNDWRQQSCKQNEQMDLLKREQMKIQEKLFVSTEYAANLEDELKYLQQMHREHSDQYKNELADKDQKFNLLSAEQEEQRVENQELQSKLNLLNNQSESNRDQLKLVVQEREAVQEELRASLEVMAKLEEELKAVQQLQLEHSLQYTSELGDRDEKIQLLKAQLGDLVCQNEELQSRHEQVEMQTQERTKLQAELQSSLEIMAQLEAELKGLQQSNREQSDHYKSELENRDEKINSLLAQLEQQVQENEELKVKLNGLNESNGEQMESLVQERTKLRLELQSSLEIMAKREEELNRLQQSDIENADLYKRELTGRDEKIAILSAQLEQNNVEIEELQLTLAGLNDQSSPDQAKIDLLSQERTKLQEELRSSLEIMAQLGEELKGLQQSNLEQSDHYKSELENRDEMTNSLLAQLELRSRENEALNSKLNELEKESGPSREEVQSLVQERLKLQEELQTALEMLAKFEEELHVLQNWQREHTERYESEMNVRDETISLLSAQLEKQREEHQVNLNEIKQSSSNEEKIDLLSQERTKLQEELQGSLEIMTKLEDELNGLRQIQRQQSDQYQNELADRDEKLTLVSIQLEQHRRENEELQFKLIGFNDNSKSADEQMGSLVQERTKLQEELQSSLEIMLKLENELKDLQKWQREHTEQYKNDLSEKTEKISLLSTQLEQNSRENEELQSKLKEFNDKSCTSDEQVEVLVKERLKLQEELQTALEMVAKLEEELKELEQWRRDNEEQLTIKDQRIDSLSHEMTLLNENLCDVKVELANAKGQLEQSINQKQGLYIAIQNHQKNVSAITFALKNMFQSVLKITEKWDLVEKKTNIITEIASSRRDSDYEIEKLKEILLAKTKEVVTLSGELEMVSKECTELEYIKAELLKNVDSLKEENLDVSLNNGELLDRLRQAEQSNLEVEQHYNGEIEKLLESIEQLKFELVGVKNELAKKVETIEKLELEMAERDRSNESMKKEMLEQINNSKLIFERQIKSLKDRKTYLEAELEASNSRYYLLEQKLADDRGRDPQIAINSPVFRVKPKEPLADEAEVKPKVQKPPVDMKGRNSRLKAVKSQRQNENIDCNQQ